MAVSPDLPEKLAATVNRHELTYHLLSDSKMRAARSFGIAFHVDDATVVRYRQYGLDLEGDSGETHHQLPVPAAYVVTEGVIQFAYVNPNYRVRIDSDVLLAAARAALPDPEDEEK